MSSMSIKNVHNENVAAWALRLGLIFVFLYAGVGSLMHPLEWIGFLPGLLTKHLDANALIKAIAIYELVLVAWLLIGKYLKIVAALCALTLVGIIVSSPGNLLITFRDVGLVFMAVALIFTDK
jgi:uncharacterized membrane protein YphA (DoxX/SURF4 family)